MTTYALLVLPAVNRVYGRAAPALTAAELGVFGATVLGGRVDRIEHRTIGGVPYVTFSAEALDDGDVRHLSNLSSIYALFEISGDGDDVTLRPVVLSPLDRYDDDLLTIPRYTGKTNEAFTKLLLNVALVCATPAAEFLDPDRRVRVLDPLCGRGTSLHQAFMYGFDACGVEVDAKAVEAYETFFEGWLKDKRLKHKVEQSRFRRQGKVAGHRTDIAVGASKAELKSGEGAAVTIVQDDTRHVAEHFKKHTFDVLVADLPYGVQHANKSDDAPVTRSPTALLADALPGWLTVLKPGAGIALAWNTKVLARPDLVAQLTDAGLTVLDEAPFSQFSHRVDRTIQRDLVVARVR